MLVSLAAGELAAGFGVFMVLGLSGAGGYRGGWLWASAIAASPAIGVAKGVWGCRRGSAVVATLAVLGGVAFGFWMSRQSQLSAPRLRQALGSFTAPPNFTAVRDEESGSVVCFDECPTFTRTWVTAATPEVAETRINMHFARHHFVIGPWHDDPVSQDIVANGYCGRVALTLAIVRQTVASDPLPPGVIEVSARLSTRLRTPKVGDPR